jgi:plastocyanin
MASARTFATKPSRRRLILAAAVVLTLALAVAGVVAAAGGAKAATITVNINRSSFSPSTITINVGDTVTWKNTDTVVHTATSSTALWDSGFLAAGATFSHTFTEAGTFNYTCTIHGFSGKVIVNAAATTSTTSPPTTSTTSTTSTTTSSTTTTTLAPGQTFVDVPPGNPYFTAIQALSSQGIINGYDVAGGLKEFRPANDVLRAQFAKMIVGALGIAVVPNAPHPFTDVTRDANGYPADYVAAAYDNHITTGRTATSFAPFVPVLRAQVTTLVVRALQQLHPGVLQDPPADYQNTWGTSFSSIHGPLARIAEFNGLLDGLPLQTTSAAPLAPMSRREVAQVLWNMMNLIAP